MRKLDSPTKCKYILFTVWGIAILLIIAREPILQLSTVMLH
jgi:hypothetical protein